MVYYLHMAKATFVDGFVFAVSKSKMPAYRKMTYFSKKYKGKEEMPMPFDPKRMTYGGFKVEVSS